MASFIALLANGLVNVFGRVKVSGSAARQMHLRSKPVSKEGPLENLRRRNLSATYNAAVSADGAVRMGRVRLTINAYRRLFSGIADR